MAPSIGGGQFSAAERQLSGDVATLAPNVDLNVEVVPTEEPKVVDERFLPHPAHAAAAPKRSAFLEQGPVIATGHPGLQGIQVVDNNPDTTAQITLNTKVVDLETDIFKGKLLLCVRGLPTSAAAAYPGGPLSCGRRTFCIAMQGSFKRPISAEALVSGQELPKPPRLSASFMHFVLAGAAKVFASTTDVFVQEGKSQYFLFPVLAAAQLLNVSRPGEEPEMLEAQEDMTLWAPELAGRGGAPATADRRRRFFDTPANLAGRTIGTDYVWTMHLYQSLVDFTTYKLGLPGVPVHIDLVSVLDTQPLQIMAKDKSSGDYVFNILIWAERLLSAQYQALENPEEQLSGFSKLKDRFKGLLSWS